MSFKSIKDFFIAFINDRDAGDDFLDPFPDPVISQSAIVECPFEENPFHANSRCHKFYPLLRAGFTVAELADKGVTKNDLKYGMEKGFLYVT